MGRVIFEYVTIILFVLAVGLCVGWSLSYLGFSKNVVSVACFLTGLVLPNFLLNKNAGN